jgi:hypothetical protein
VINNGVPDLVLSESELLWVRACWPYTNWGGYVDASVVCLRAVRSLELMIGATLEDHVVRPSQQTIQRPFR